MRGSGDGKQFHVTLSRPEFTGEANTLSFMGGEHAKLESGETELLQSLSIPSHVCFMSPSVYHVLH